MCAEKKMAALGNLVDVVNENDSTATKPLDHELIVDNLVECIQGCAK